MPQQYIYFIQEEETNYIKIGFSENPVQRLKDFQTGNPNKLELIGQIEGGADEENNIHREFAEERIRETGEWFRPSERLTNFIKQSIEKSVDNRLTRNDSFGDGNSNFETDEGEKIETDEGLYNGQSINRIPNGYGTMEYFGDDFKIYYGEWKNGRKHGHGTLSINNENNPETYEGDWKNDKKDGYGKEKSIEFDGLESAITYEGEFKQGKFDGFGSKINYYRPESVHENDEVEDGKEIIKTEIGIWKAKKILEYEGEFKDGEPHGKGKFTSSNYTYEGECNDGARHGHGVEIIFGDNGGVYEGEWKDGRKNGKGEITYSNGEKYIGEWKEDKREGQGTYTWPHGSKYVGEWKNNGQNGQGTLTYESGNKFEGGWKDGKMHGQGTENRPNGEKFMGEWKDGKKNGQGTLFFSNGEKYYEGEWKDGKQHGKGTQYYNEGSVKYFGNWKDGKYHGLGTKYLRAFIRDLNDGITIGGDGEWKEGRMFNGKINIAGDWYRRIENGKEVATFSERKSIVGRFLDAIK